MSSEALNYYQIASLQIQDFCRPLNTYFGIPLVVYFKAFQKDGSYILLSNDNDIVQKYCSTINQEVLYATDCLDLKSKYQHILWPDDSDNQGSRIYLDKSYWHGFTIIHNSGEEFECFCFLSNKDNPTINEFFIKHYNILEKFTDHFKDSFNDTILIKSLYYKTQYKYGCDFHLPEKKLINSSDINDFSRTTGIDKGVLNIDGKFICLTDREKECLKLINEGLSLKGVSNRLLLSPKTIEFHLNNVKDKTGFLHKQDLIKMYRDSFLCY